MQNEFDDSHDGIERDGDLAVDLDALRSMLEAGFRRYLGEVEAVRIVDALIDAEVCEVRSHGILRVPWYLDAFERGAFNTEAEIRVHARNGCSFLVDGDRAIGYLPTWIAIEGAAQVASRTSLAVAGVRNIGEFGRAGYYAEELARRGLIAIVCQNTPPLLSSPGSRTRTHGNNPLAFSAPGPDAPLFDAAFTPRSAGELRRLSLLGEGLPAALGYVDEQGEPITDPAVAFGKLMPAVGGAKGFGISLLVDLLAGALTGAATGPDVRRGVPEVGAFIFVLTPDLFGADATLQGQLTRSADAVRDGGGRWPGDRARRTRAKNLDRGYVEVAPQVHASIRDAMEGLCSEAELEAALGG